MSLIIQIQILNNNNVENTYLVKGLIELKGTLTGKKELP